MDNREIIIKGARVNNLKNIDLKLPLNRFTVFTGVSGSGKSSLAFDTLYAEGQRRYVESLSAYARQFLGRMPKPECDYIKGLPPAIAIEQKVTSRNPRSTVGTSTEIYDYLRMLFAKAGHTFSPVSGREVKRNTIDDTVNTLMEYPAGTRMAIVTDIIPPEGRDLSTQLDIFLKEGFSRVEKDGNFIEISELLQGDDIPEGLHLLIDRVAIPPEDDEESRKDMRSRIADSLETAYFEGNDSCTVLVFEKDSGIKTLQFSNSFSADGMTFREPTEQMFNFNNPFGACPTCEGFGKVMGVSEDLVVPDKSKSIMEDAVACWRGEKMSECKRDFIRAAKAKDFPIFAPYSSLTPDQLKFLWKGEGRWYGIDGFFKWVDEQQYKIQYRVMKARYRGKSVCPTCDGGRLRPDAEYVKVGGKSISDLVRMPIDDLALWFDNLTLPPVDAKIAERLLTEIRTRLTFLKEVGLGYLTLDRLSNTLSGGESQRINLATSLGSSLVGSLYILDEPSIGLHSRDTHRLIKVLKKLRDIGNTVVVVEHDEEIMLAADDIVDIGKDAGRHGGEIIYHGNLKEALEGEDSATNGSYTIDYLKGNRSIPLPSLRRPWKDFISVEGASENNLKNIDAKFPLGVLTMVTGVSGSGKSTLVKDILYKGLGRKLGLGLDSPGRHKQISGSVEKVGAVEFVDQNPIGTSTRSNPATYLKAFDEIRKLMAEQPLAKQMGFTPGFFSFNSEGGRCEECKGEGKLTIPMQFMADIQVDCDTCGGKRYKKDVLEVEYRGKNINDFLEMTVNQAIEFLEEKPGAQEKRIISRLKPLQDVGLGYIKLGQSSSTLSGGENQRVKLAYFIAKEYQPHTLFIFDEPTTGLHFHDIQLLLKSLNRLIEEGHSVVVIEHNMDMIKCADHIIDIGPEGGEAGGTIVAAGTPETIAQCADSYTGQFLKEKLKTY